MIVNYNFVKSFYMFNSVNQREAEFLMLSSFVVHILTVNKLSNINATEFSKNTYCKKEENLLLLLIMIINYNWLGSERRWNNKNCLMLR